MKYAYINTHANKLVLAWLDTDAQSFVMPAPEYLHICTNEEWALKNSGDEYQLAANGRLIPYDPPAVDMPAIRPSTCTPVQGLIALFAIKRITEDDVLSEIARITGDIERYTAKIGYQRATTWERNSPTMQTMAQLLQLSDDDLDELFTYAAGVAV